MREIFRRFIEAPPASKETLFARLCLNVLSTTVTPIWFRIHPLFGWVVVASNVIVWAAYIAAEWHRVNRHQFIDRDR